jgi:hypothetical protein
MSGKGAKERRIAKRRETERFGLTDEEFKVFKRHYYMLDGSLSHDKAMKKVEEWRFNQLPFKEREKAKKKSKWSDGRSPLLEGK